MVDSVLVAYDGSPQSDEALDYALAEHPGATITVLTVIDPVSAGYSADVTLTHTAEDWYREAKAEAEEDLEEARERATEAGVGVETVVEVGRPASTIVEYVEEHGCDQIVIGSHGRTGVSRILVGSVAEKVMRTSPVPVTVVR